MEQDARPASAQTDRDAVGRIPDSFGRNVVPGSAEMCQKWRMAEGSTDLPTDVDTLQAMVVAMQEREAQLRHIIDQLQRWRFGPRSEKLSPDQYDLTLEDREIANAEAQALLEMQQDVADRAKGKRKAREPGKSRPSVPAHLPHVEQLLLPDATSCPCCGGALHEIDRDIAKRLDKVPARYRVIVTIRPRLACRTCSDGVLQAPARPGLFRADYRQTLSSLTSWSRNMPTSYRSIARSRSSGDMASRLTGRRFVIGSGGLQRS